MADDIMQCDQHDSLIEVIKRIEEGQRRIERDTMKIPSLGKKIDDHVAEHRGGDRARDAMFRLFKVIGISVAVLGTVLGGVWAIARVI